MNVEPPSALCGHKGTRTYANRCGPFETTSITEDSHAIRAAKRRKLEQGISFDEEPCPSSSGIFEACFDCVPKLGDGLEQNLKHPAPLGSGEDGSVYGEKFNLLPEKSLAESSGDSVPNLKSQSTHAEEIELCCFGTLIGLEAERRSVCCAENCIMVWTGTTFLQCSVTGMAVYELSQNAFPILQSLYHNGGVLFQFQSKQVRGGVVKPMPKEERIALKPIGDLSVILYGPPSVSDEVGNFLQECQMYLQVPDNCDRDVPYVNPHCLFALDEPWRMTHELHSNDPTQVETDDNELQFDLLKYSNSDEVFEEAPQPHAVETLLLSHQRQALTFMLCRERGWDFEGHRRDVWMSYLDVRGITRYRNNITGSSQEKPPPSFRGGILADEMGLGKTVSMLSLITANRCTPQSEILHGRKAEHLISVKSTLIVVPFSLLQVWEAQIERHLKTGDISYLVFYGPGREKHGKLLDEYDIVLTTFNTVASDWKRRRASRDNGQEASLFSKYWHRIVLDEAHTIRSRQTKSAKAVCALHATHRWCITGTPLQNRLDDLSSLLQFLRVHPFGDLRVFEAEISGPLRNEMNESGLSKLQSLVRMIMIRRPRAVIDLPTRHGHVRHVAFDANEKALYESKKSGTIEMIETAIASAAPPSTGYFNALKRINDLRFICNHGVLPPTRQKGRIQRCADRQGLEAFCQDDIDATFSIDQTCAHCGTDIVEELEEDVSTLNIPHRASNNTSAQLCSGCLYRQRELGGYSPFSPASSASSHVASLSLPSSTHSSKINAVLSYIQVLPVGEKCAIFSYWTTTLDHIEQALANAMIETCRYDGRLTRTKRGQVLDAFRSNGSVQVILVSISCGAQGLDLTAANHALIVEPQWNPMLEEQALSRVHRMGQKKPVETIRFVMSDTWEEKIITVQERKKYLSDLVTNKRRLEAGDDGKRRLLDLRELIV